MSRCPHCNGTGIRPDFIVGDRVELSPEFDATCRQGTVTEAGTRKISVLIDGEKEPSEWTSYWHEIVQWDGSQAHKTLGRRW